MDLMPISMPKDIDKYFFNRVKDIEMITTQLSMLEKDILFVDCCEDRAGLAVEPVLGTGVADVLDDPARQLGDVHVGPGRDLSRDHHQARRAEHLAGHAAVGVILQDCVQDAVRDLIGDLVGVPLRYGLRGEDEFFRVCHSPTSRE